MNKSYLLPQKSAFVFSGPQAHSSGKNVCALQSGCSNLGLKEPGCDHDIGGSSGC